MSYNKIIIVGNLAADPELRYTGDGTAYATFRMASNDYGKTTWFRVTVWRKQAEATADNMKKGRQVLVEGRMNPDPTTGSPKVWVSSSGESRATYEITADKVVFLGGGSREEPEKVEEKAADPIPF